MFDTPNEGEASGFVLGAPEPLGIRAFPMGVKWGNSANEYLPKKNNPKHMMDSFLYDWGALRECVGDVCL